MSRQPITIVEIDFPKCSRTFGTSPCTAVLSPSVPRKCFNSRKTCADPANYDASQVLTLRFAQNQTGIPGGMTIFPTLQSVSTRAAEINLSGMDGGMSALGKRARVTVSIADFPYHDTLTDPYQAERVSGAAQYSGVGYDPAARGTFLGRLVARQPYYVGLPLRVLRGYVGDALGAMDTAHYVISEWSGPGSDGLVTITAKDILDLADNTKAVAPALSLGKLDAGISAGATTLTLTPAGIGSTYAASGRICIGREVMYFTRSGDAMTIYRAMDGTTAASHSALDAVQQCFTVEDTRPCDVIYYLLTTFANVPSSYIDLTAWRVENDDWLASLRMTATVAKPTGVASLIGEICQHGMMVWWDEIAQQIRFRANRPLRFDEAPVVLTDSTNFLRGSVDVDMADDQRVSAVIFFHGMLDPTGSATDGNNFSRAALSAVEQDFYGQEKIRTIYSRWFGQAGNDAAANSIAVHLRNRFQTTPKILTANLDIKDLPNIGLGSVISGQSYLIQSDDGSTNAEPMQISYREVKEGIVAIKAQSWTMTGRYGWVAAYGTPDYGSATADQKKHGAFVVAAASPSFADGTGPYIAF